MIIGSFPFLLLAQTTLTNFSLFKDHQVRVLIFILMLAITLIFYFARPYVDGSILNQLSTISFNTISIISGTGYVSTNFEK